MKLSLTTPVSVLLSLVLCCTAAVAADRIIFKTGKDLHEGLQQDGAGNSQTLNYIVGVVDAANGAPGREGFCFDLKSEVVSAARIADVVRPFAVKNPQMWDRPGSTLVAAALQEAWPCK
jgi:Rap1a immunity proteins